VQAATALLLGIATVTLMVRGIGAYWSGSPRIAPDEIENVGYQVDLNSADRAELLQLPGIGESLAQRILDYRYEHGGFQHVDELRGVRGIGPITLEKLRPWVYVSEPDEIETEGDEPAPRVRTARMADRNAPPRAPAATGKKMMPGDAPLDLNQATGEDLQRIPGIGPKLAEAIVAARETKPFEFVDALRRVKGIGAKTLEKVRPFVIVRFQPDDAALGKK
jgi:competence protein ComEA